MSVSASQESPPSCVCGRERGRLLKGIVDTRELRSDRKSRLASFRILMWRSTEVPAFHETLTAHPLYQHLRPDQVGVGARLEIPEVRSNPTSVSREATTVDEDLSTSARAKDARPRHEIGGLINSSAHQPSRIPDTEQSHQEH